MKTITNSNKMKSHECTNTYSKICISFVNLWQKKMKKIILIFIAVSMFMQLASGQEYVPLLGENKQWNVMDASGFGWVVTKTYMYKTTGKDTIIESKLYSIIEKYDSLSNHISYVFAREDSDGNFFARIWSPFNTDIEDVLLYDFSLEVGDTFSLHNNIDFVVVSIDSITLSNNERRKIWNFEAANWTDKCNYYPDYDDRWIEGIGSINGIFSPGCVSYTDYLRLLCFYDNNNILYQHSIDENCFVSSVGINEDSLDVQIQIYPNPASNHITIETTANQHLPYQLEIFDITGRIVHSEVLSESKTLININMLHSGMYFAKIQQGSHVQLKKFIKN